MLALAVPDAWYRRQCPRLLAGMSDAVEQRLRDRVDYYYKVAGPFHLPDGIRPFRLSLTQGRSNYYFDLHEYARYFDPSFRLGYIFGDNTSVPPCPTLVKSRPIVDGNAHAVLFNLNKIRHFVFTDDRSEYEGKLDKVVWRGRAFQPQRKEFLRRFHDHPRCDVGHHHRKHQDVPWIKPRLTIAEQLRYKFILAIEGNDVASNLKWIMSSNSLCFMPPPRHETWFMEGRLEPGRQVVVIREDFGDLEEKMDYYLAHPAEARSVIREARAWVNGFRDAETERLASLMVLWKYFHDSGQLDVTCPRGRAT